MSHAGHWACIDGLGDETAAAWLPRISRFGTPIIDQATRRSQQAPPPAPGEIIFGLSYPDADLRGLALLVSGGGGGTIPAWGLAGSYPFVAAGVAHRLQLEGVIERNDGAEAIIEASLPDGERLAFFDPLYFLYRRRYRLGGTYEFALGALAYAIQVADPEPLYPTVRQPSPVHDDYRADGGALLPATLPPDMPAISLAGAAMLFPIETGGPDDYLFHAPVHEITSFDLEGQEILAMRVTLRHSNLAGRLDVTLYAATRLFAGGRRPQAGDDVSGALWLQGSRRDPVV